MIDSPLQVLQHLTKNSSNPCSYRNLSRVEVISACLFPLCFWTFFRILGMFPTLTFVFGGKKKPYCTSSIVSVNISTGSLKGWHVEYLTPLFGIKEFIYHSHWSRYYCLVDLIHIYDPPLRLLKEENNATTQLSPCAGCQVQNLIHAVVI